MRLFRRKCAFLLDIFALITLFCLSVLVVYVFWKRHPRGSGDGGDGMLGLSFLATLPLVASAADLAVREEEDRFIKESGWKIRTNEFARKVSEDSDDLRPENCTMGRCFDMSRCLGEFRVYVYPDTEGSKVSGLFKKFLRILRTSQYYTTDPDKACVFVPSFDTLDRDKLSDDFNLKLPSPWLLPHWNGGRNHLFFTLYPGSWPSYSETLDFDTGLAMVAKASFNIQSFRNNFDISIPLTHNSHPERGVFPAVMTTEGNILPPKRKYHLAFKGKRYLYGLGVEPRRSLYHIHNNRDIVMVTTCRHNKNWERYQDSRCSNDNAQYNRYDYGDLMSNATFCLVPRGRRLGSFRFIEALQASCIPVSLSNGYVLPFSEVIDWNLAAVIIDERHVLQIPHVTRSLATQQVLSMRSQGSWLYETYLSSVEQIVMTMIEIIRNRLRPSTPFVWNQKPGGLNFEPSFSSYLADYPFYRHGNTTNYTIVVTCFRSSLKGTSPLIKLIKTLSRALHLSKVYILWGGYGSPKISLPPLPITVTTITRPSLRINPLSRFYTVPGIETDVILHLSEDVELTVDEAEFGMETWLAFPDRLVGYVTHTHSWDKDRLKWTYNVEPNNEYSIVLTGAVFYHRYYSHILVHSLPQSIAHIATTEPDCTDLVFNFYVSHITGKSPIKATHKQSLIATTTTTPTPTTVVMETTPLSFSQTQIPCLNLLVTAFGYMPLKYSSVRFDPVLFKDSVSMLRKEYRTLDRL